MARVAVRGRGRWPCRAGRWSRRGMVDARYQALASPPRSVPAVRGRRRRRSGGARRSRPSDFLRRRGALRIQEPDASSPRYCTPLRRPLGHRSRTLTGPAAVASRSADASPSAHGERESPTDTTPRASASRSLRRKSRSRGRDFWSPHHASTRRPTTPAPAAGRTRKHLAAVGHSARRPLCRQRGRELRRCRTEQSSRPRWRSRMACGEQSRRRRRLAGAGRGADAWVHGRDQPAVRALAARPTQVCARRLARPRVPGDSESLDAGCSRLADGATDPCRDAELCGDFNPPGRARLPSDPQTRHG
ncbi:MAG: hypothetical protein QOH12_1486 [Solirubrobacteraceae bacterium]|nr:hypothetical protein [Solirubrobacteraceae bacterium]